MPADGLPDLSEIDPGFWLLVGTVVAAVVLVGLLFLLLGSILEFVLVESLRRETVTVRRYWRRRWRQGLRLFGFRLALGLAVFSVGAVLAATVVLPLLEVGPDLATGVSVAWLVVLIPFFLVIALLVALVNAFTTVFVVPIMILGDCGVLAGWRRLRPTITAHPWQYVAYAVAGFILAVAAGFVVGIVVAVAAVALLIPLGLLAVVGFVLLGAVPLLGVVLMFVAGVAFVLAMLVAFALAQVPVAAFLRYYALLILGDVEPDLDLIPDRRAAVRADDETPDASSG